MRASEERSAEEGSTRRHVGIEVDQTVTMRCPGCLRVRRWGPRRRVGRTGLTLTSWRASSKVDGMCIKSARTISVPIPLYMSSVISDHRLRAIHVSRRRVFAPTANTLHVPPPLSSTLHHHDSSALTESMAHTTSLKPQVRNGTRLWDALTPPRPYHRQP